MKKVLIVNSSFWPGYKSGGPQRTIENICSIYADKSDIYLLTLNHDMGEKEEYNFPTNEWVDVKNIKVRYVTDKEYGAPLFIQMYRQFSTIYTCGLFARNTYLLLIINKLLFKREKHTLYVAPMGVFSEGAFSSKYLKKKLFMRLFSFGGMFDKIVWSFSSIEELEDAKRVIGNGKIRDYIIAEDPPRKMEYDISSNHREKKNKKLRIVFISRVVPKKNLTYCLDILNWTFKGDIEFDIYGIIEDLSYWEKVKEKISETPNNVRVTYCGELKPDEVFLTFSNYDMFLFPTKGENYGHVIYESLASGCVPVISNQTPWKDFEIRNCGFVIPLTDIGLFRARIQTLLDMDYLDYVEMKHNAIRYAKEKYAEAVNSTGYNKVFIE